MNVSGATAYQLCFADFLCPNGSRPAGDDQVGRVDGMDGRSECIDHLPVEPCARRVEMQADVRLVPEHEVVHRGSLPAPVVVGRERRGEVTQVGYPRGAAVPLVRRAGVGPCRRCSDVENGRQSGGLRGGDARIERGPGIAGGGGVGGHERGVRRRRRRPRSNGRPNERTRPQRSGSGRTRSLRRCRRTRTSRRWLCEAAASPGSCRCAPI